MVVAPTPTSTERPAIAAARRGAVRIALIYVAIGLAWITGSDHLVDTLFSAQYAAIAQTLKGYAYVVLTGYLLYVAISRLTARASSTQQRLTQSESVYRNLFESHPQPMFVYEIDTLRFIAVNQAALTKYGYTRAEFLALTLRELHPPDELDEFNRRFNMRNKYFEAVTEFGPFRHWTKDRHILDVQISSNTLDFDGKRRMRVVLALDVSERMRGERALRDAQSNFKEVARLARLGWWSIDRANGEVVLSEQMQSLALDIGVRSINPEALFQHVHSNDRDALQQAYERALSGMPFEIEVRVVRGDNTIVWLLLRGELSARADGGAQVIGTALDVTARKQAERDMQQSETQYRRLVEYLPEAVVLHCNACVTFVNPAAVALFGAANPGDLLGKSIEQFIAAPSIAAARERFALVQEGSGADAEFHERLLKKLNGEVFSAEVAAQSVMIDGRRCIQALIRDIGVRKKTQMELRLANERLLHLSMHMIEAGENERRQLSRELHDDLGQALTFIKMTAAWLRKRVTAAEPAERIDQITAVAGDALAKVRNLALALRPAQLDALGLKAAMEEHINRFCSGSGIEYALQLQELEPRPQPALEIALFRILQEALTNIFRHSGANFIEVTLARRNGAIVLHVVDDGCGFDVDAALLAGTSLGLQTMTERAQQLQGTLQWHSVAGVGTELIATIPESVA